MEFIHKFDTIADFNDGIKNYVEPWVSYTQEINRIDYNNIMDTNGYEFVNLGLPSGTLWATCNVGASSPEEYGGYYAWGEIEEKESYSENNYKWYSNSAYTKYNSTDGKTTLDLEDDVVHVVMGGRWQLPTQAQILELENAFTDTPIIETINNKSVMKITSKYNGNVVLFPISGYKSGSSLNLDETNGYIWSNTKDTDTKCYSARIRNSNGVYWYGMTSYKYYGQNARGVITPPQISNS